MPLAPLPPHIVHDVVLDDDKKRRRRTQRRDSVESQSLYDNLASYTFGDVRQVDTNNNDADDEDDLDEDKRQDRAKMRAIDDGSRRPSLPSNIPSPTSRRSSLPIAVPVTPATPNTQLMPPTSSDSPSPYAGFDLSYILAPPVPASFPPRRPSTASALSLSDGLSDTFARHVKKNDSEYERRRAQWSFRNTAGVASRPGSEKGGYQVWSCDTIGRFAISKCKPKESQSDRPPPIRFLIRPLPWNSHPPSHHLQPTHIIHKHSKTRAYSLFRSPSSTPSSTNPPNRTSPAPTSVQVNPSGFVLLAPMRIQVAYTETKSTRSLQTYNFLGDDHQKKDPIIPKPNTVPPRERSASPIHPSAPPIIVSPPIPIDSSPSPDFDFHDWEDDNRGPSKSPSPPPPDPTPIPVQVAFFRQSTLGEKLKRAFAVSPTTAPEHAHVYPPSNSTTDHVHHDFTAPYTPPWLTLPLRAEQERNERTMYQLNKSFEDVGLLPASRPHRSNSKKAIDNHRADKEKLDKPNKKKGGRKRKLGGVFEEVPDDAMVMLLPMWGFEVDSSDENGKESSMGNVPPLEERRYLLVYYVAFEGSGSETAHPKTTATATPAKDAKKRTRLPLTAEWERATESSLRSSTEDNKDREKEKDKYLTAYRVVAKVLSYEDVRGSGLRLPDEGLFIPPIPISPPPTSYGSSGRRNSAYSVRRGSGHSTSLSVGWSTPSANSPMQPTYQQPPRTKPTYHFDADPDAAPTIIAICPSESSAIEFIPEGLDKLGLCSSSPLLVNGSVISSPMWVDADGSWSGERERLSTLGRAIVEMCWCGCMSVMGIGSGL